MRSVLAAGVFVVQLISVVANQAVIRVWIVPDINKDNVN